MDADLIQEIVESVINERLVENWVFYFLIAVFSGFAGGFAAYIRSKAENLATKEDLKHIWLAKEKNAIKRQKIEELIVYAESTQEYYRDELLYTWTRKKNRTERNLDPYINALMIQKLYFPELRDEYREISVVTDKIQKLITKSLKMIREEDSPEFSSVSDEYTPLVTELDKALIKLTNEASIIMSKLLKEL